MTSAPPTAGQILRRGKTTATVVAVVPDPHSFGQAVQVERTDGTRTGETRTSVIPLAEIIGPRALWTVEDAAAEGLDVVSDSDIAAVRTEAARDAEVLSDRRLLDLLYNGDQDMAYLNTDPLTRDGLVMTGVCYLARLAELDERYPGAARLFPAADPDGVLLADLPVPAPCLVPGHGH